MQKRLKASQNIKNIDDLYCPIDAGGVLRNYFIGVCCLGMSHEASAKVKIGCRLLPMDI